MIDLGHLGSIGLEALIREGELLVRRDSKYVVDDSAMRDIVDALGADALVLRTDPGRKRNAARYRTRYFDTPDQLSYRDHVMERRQRYKVRVRQYLDTGDAFFEVKARLPLSQTEKDRWPLDPAVAERLFGSPDPLSDEHLALVGEVIGELYGRDVRGPLVPTIDMTFERATVFLPESRERATIDTSLVVTDVATGLTAAANPDVHVVEVKSPGRRDPVGRSLLRSGIRKLPVSKYCIALAVLRGPQFRANHWIPTMRLLFPVAASDASSRDVA